MPDPSAIDSAVLAMLQSDSQLQALAPDGVYFDQAPPNSQRFVLVSLVITEDRAIFGRRGIESILYLVKAVMRTTANGDIKGAAARIEALIEDQPLTVSGYGWMASAREERVRYTEVDDLDPSIRWSHRGGHYRIEMSVN